ncbi:carboxypeptidase-like regulatory domain-containing protein [Hymenobacter metallilatus]|nr:carboxypeptidase-like regulatory domain-containing protein [Hymenobacter metallilatus]
MTPAAQGRHCGSCNKTVVDFTSLTDAEVVAWLARHSGPVCGRLWAGQLDRALMPAAVPAPRWRMWLAAGLAVLGGRQLLPDVAEAQTVQVVQRVAFNRINESPEPHTPLHSITIQGRVVDNNTGEGIPFASLGLQRTEVGCLTDEHGYFTCEVPAKRLNKFPTDTLIALALGFERYEIPLDFATIPTLIKLNVMMQAKPQSEAAIMTGMIVVRKSPNTPADTLSTGSPQADRKRQKKR